MSSQTNQRKFFYIKGRVIKFKSGHQKRKQLEQLQLQNTDILQNLSPRKGIPYTNIRLCCTKNEMLVWFWSFLHMCSKII